MVLHKNANLSNNKKEKKHKAISLQHRLILFFSFVTVFLVFLFTMLLLLFGINGKEEKTVQTYFDTELTHVSDSIFFDFGNLSVDGIDMANSIAFSCEDFFNKNDISAQELRYAPELIEPLLSLQIQTLLNTANSHSCGGVFLLLDSSVQQKSESTNHCKAGIFIKKTQPNSTQSVGAKLHYLRGPAQIARDNGIELMGQWQMEYDISEEDFFTLVMETAQKNSNMPLSRLYYWTPCVTLKGNSEAGFLLCVPLRTNDGTVFGVCGIEVSDRMFKQLYSPNNSAYENVFTVAAPYNDNTFYASQGIIAGNYYLTGIHMFDDLNCISLKNGLTGFESDKICFGGKIISFRLYPFDSVYNQQWAVAVMMPTSLLNEAVQGKSQNLIIIISILLAVSLTCSIIISRRYLNPVTKAFNSIRSSSYAQPSNSTYSEISDLFDFLAQKDKEHKENQLRIESEKAQAIADGAKVKAELYKQDQNAVVPEQYEMFCKNLKTLTEKEHEVFDLYLDGLKAKEIAEELQITFNTVKFHNKNIYDKLGVSSRTELLRYANHIKNKTVT